MEDLLDSLWLKILVIIQYLKACLDYIFSPLDPLGPALAIFIIALFTVTLAKLFSRSFKTRRLRRLEEEFMHWYKVREEAARLEDADPEKRRLLAKNIDQSKLNRLYYDMFLEGLLNNVLTIYIPILLMLAYVNEAYSPGSLTERFGRGYIFKLGGSGPGAANIGAAFWFVISVVLIYLGWFIAARLYKRYVSGSKSNTVPKGYSNATPK